MYMIVVLLPVRRRSLSLGLRLCIHHTVQCTCPATELLFLSAIRYSDNNHDSVAASRTHLTAICFI